MSRLTVVGLMLGLIAAVTAADDPPRAVPDVAALVRRLGSEDFREREAASAELAALVVAEPPAELLAALRSPDPEVRERAAKAIKAIRAAAALRPLPRGERFAARGQVDLYVASTADLKWKPEDDRLWLPPFNIGMKLMSLAEMNADRKPQGDPTWVGDFATYRTKRLAEFVRTDGTYVRRKENASDKWACFAAVAVQADCVEAEALLTGLIVVRGPVSAEKSLEKSLVLTTGNVKTKSLMNSVVVCDGDVVVDTAWKSLIVARGKIDVRDAFASTLIAGGTVTVGQLPAIQLEPIREGASPMNVRHALALKDLVRVEIRERQVHPLGFVTFFELARVGLSVRVADGAVTVVIVAPGSACEKAGLRVGDVILEAGGKKPADAESLRRALRDALAVGDAAVKVKRGNDTPTVKVTLPE
jgi:hypothetical protein